MSYLSSIWYTLQKCKNYFLNTTQMGSIHYNMTCIGAYCVWQLSYWGIFEWYRSIYSGWVSLFIHQTYFEFITRNGNSILYQTGTCKEPTSNPITGDAYEYVVYTNNQIKSFIPISQASSLYDGKHINVHQKVVKPTMCSIGISVDDGSDPVDIEFKTDAYNYYVNGNVFNKCTLTYFLSTHYSDIKLSDTYSIFAVTPTGTIRMYDDKKPFIIEEV